MPVTVEEQIHEALRDQPPVLDLPTAAKVSSLSTKTLRRRIKSGELKTAMKSRESRGGRVLILKDELVRMLARMAE